MLRSIKTWFRFFYIPFIILSLILFSCGGGGSSGGGNNPNLNGNLSGKVSSNVQAGDVSGSLAASSATNPVLMGSLYHVMESSVSAMTFSPGTCASATYNVQVVGGGSTAVTSGSVINGVFEITGIPADKEVVVNFSCGAVTERCFGKPGTEDLVCDPLSHAIVSALESALGKDITDSLFDGVQISVIAAGQAASLRFEWSFHPERDLSQPILTNMTNKAALYNILLGSSFGDTLGLLKAKADEQALINSGSTGDQAAAATWTVRNVVNYIVNLGMDIVVQLEDSDGPGQYNILMDQIDNMTGTTFNRDLRTFLGQQYNKVYTQKIDDPIKMVCVAENSHNWQSKTLEYAPVASVLGTPPTYSDAVLTCIPTNANMAAMVQNGQCIDTSITVMGSCPTGGTMVWDPNKSVCYDSAQTTYSLCITNHPPDSTSFKWDGDYNVYLSLRPSKIEANRNDPTGLNIKSNNLTRISMRSLEIYPEVERSLGFDGISTNANNPFGLQCVGYMNMDFTLNASYPGLLDGSCNPQKLGKYFSGVLGMYKFFRNSAIRDYKFSLRELHQAFVGPNYMSIRFDGNLWDINKSQNVELIPSNGNGERLQFPRWQLIDNGDGTLSMVCPFNGSYPPIPTTDDPGSPPGYPNTICTDNNNYTNTISGVPIDTLNTYITPMMALTEPLFSSTFQDYTQIPTISEIQNFVFTSTHHETWNIAGPTYYNVKGLNTAGSVYDAEIPILCHIVSPNISGEFVIGTSSIVCLQASGTWTNGKPDATTYNLYKNYYGLQERGASSNGYDTFYALISVSSGQDLRVNGREIRVRGIMSNTTTGFTYDPALDTVNTVSTLDGKTLYNVDAQFCSSPYTDSTGQVVPNCWRELFDYVAIALPTAWYPAAEYTPYYWDIPVGNNYFRVAVDQIQVSPTPNDYKDDYPVCILGDTDGAAAGVETGVVAETIPGTPFVNPYNIVSVSLGADSVVNCFDSTANPTGRPVYFLALQWGQVLTGGYLYKLIYMDGGWTFPKTNTGICSEPAYNTDFYGCISDSLNYGAGPYTYTEDTMLTRSTVEAWLAANRLGPAVAYTHLVDYSLANYKHDPKYDPYCAVTSTVLCDTNKDGKYSLLDSPAEGDTISDPIIWYNSSDPISLQQYYLFQAINNACGGLSGDNLAVCLKNTVYNGQDITQLTYANFNIWFVCTTTSYPMGWIDIYAAMDPSAANGGTDGYLSAGENCLDGAGGYGEVTLLRILERENAYDIAKPNTLMKVISAGTASIGTGNIIDPDAKIFTFSEALPLTLSRVMIPVGMTIKDDVGTPQPNVRAFFTVRRTFENRSEAAVSGLLRAFLEKSGAL